MKHLSELRIDLSAIQFNLAQVKKRVGAGCEIMAVIKADAYGHGAETLALFLESRGITTFAVAQAFEGVGLRHAGIKGRILVLQPSFHTDLEAYRDYDMECSISTLSDFDHISAGPEINAHLFVDTGMGREGAMPDFFEACLERALSHPALNLVGIATHFAGSDEADLTFAYEQLRRFKAMTDELPAGVRERVQLHAANSGAIVNLPEAHFDMVRPGILLYGQYTGAGRFPQKPAMSAYGRLVTVKDVPHDYPVGYGSTWRAPRATRLGLVCAGYADGYARLHHESAAVWIHGEAYPVVGRVSMDVLVIDLGPDRPAAEGDEVLMLGGDADQPSSIAHEAALLNTVTYERCCQLGSRMPRVYLGV